MSSNPRVHEIAATYGVDSRTVLLVLKELGEFAKGPSSSLAPPTARKLTLALEALGYREGTVRPIHTVSAPAARVVQTPPRALVDGNPFTRPRVQDTPAEAENRAFIAAVFNMRPDDVKLRRDSARHYRKGSEPPRASKTDVEWASYFFDSAERADWVAAGIGDENARLASDLRQRGIEPWHLQQKIDGRTVAERLGGGDSFDRVVSKALELSA